ncbi:phosphatidylinositol synthase 1 (CDP-alcohol phosphatidyltransferase1) [Vanrija albida]|uniref:Phosphatidylinositol synthase 1 (CDP-alcohol phosphatidyltransferase1) n=1 Tax=Vanrija albida TaxID=181172 RepID=A0ABR3QB10_9TREE
MAPTTRSQVSAESSPAPSSRRNAATSSAVNSHSGTIRQRQRQNSTHDAKESLDLATTTVEDNVFFFVPNLIGYARVILAAASLYFMPWHPKICTVLYGVSCLLDAFDGLAARLLDQETKFGAVLDMVTDRCTTACLLTFLAATYTEKGLPLLFQFLIALDFASHYMHMYSSLVTGATSHKNVGQEVSRILWYYYNDRTTLFIFCFANELFFVCLYLNASVERAIFSGSLAHYAPFLADVPIIGWMTWPQLIGLLCFPIMFAKQVINVVQFWKASKILVGIDIANRQEARKNARKNAVHEDHAEAIVDN